MGDGIRVLENKTPSEICESLKIFAKYGSFAYLKKIFNNNALWDSIKSQLLHLDFCSYAAKYKNFTMLQQLVSYGFKYDEITSSYAIINNDFVMLKWLEEHQCQKSDLIKLLCAEDLRHKNEPLREIYGKDSLLATHVSLNNENLEMFEWLLGKNYAINYSIPQLLLKSENKIQRNHLLKWIINHRSYSILMDQIKVTTFVRENDFAMLQWSIDKGCKVDQNSTKIAIINNNFEMLKCWLNKIMKLTIIVLSRQFTRIIWKYYSG